MSITNVYWVLSGWDRNGQFHVSYITNEPRVNTYDAARSFGVKRLGFVDVSVCRRIMKPSRVTAPAPIPA